MQYHGRMPRNSAEPWTCIMSFFVFICIISFNSWHVCAFVVLQSRTHQAYGMFKLRSSLMFRLRNTFKNLLLRQFVVGQMFWPNIRSHPFRGKQQLSSVVGFPSVCFCIDMKNRSRVCFNSCNSSSLIYTVGPKRCH